MREEAEKKIKKAPSVHLPGCFKPSRQGATAYAARMIFFGMISHRFQ
jgi:hypothetical protein